MNYKKIVLFLLVLASAAWAIAVEARFMTYPDIHGDKIVFTYEGDLWLASANGGNAARLTSFPGDEYAAKFSPDGQWLAFTGNYDGQPAVYLMAAAGGEPRRLTYQPGSVQTVAWTPDGQRIVFRSNLEQFISRTPKLFWVKIDGTAPESLPIDRGTLCSFNGSGSEMLYNRRGNEEYQWKRYKGGQHTDIWRYNFVDRQFNPVSDYVGKNAYPMWIGASMVFVSDRGQGGICNLYAQDLETMAVTQVTHHEKYDVMMPETDGERIVYLQDGYLWRLDVKSGASEKIPLALPSDRWLLRSRWLNPKDYIHAMDVGNDGKAALLEARGDIFLLPVKTGQTRNLSESSASREIHPRLSPDGQWLSFFSDRSGEYQLYRRKVAGGEWQQLTSSLDRAVYRQVWSPDGRKILFGNKDMALFWLDVETKQLTPIDAVAQLKNDEFTWEMDDYGWSPDSLWVCYTMVAYNRNSQVFLYSLEQKKKFAVSDDFYNNLNPCFDANGDYLYYLSSRNFDVAMDFYEDNHVISKPFRVMAVQLQGGQKPPFLEGQTEKGKTEGGKLPVQAKRVKIDLDGLAIRTFALPVTAGNYAFLRAGRGQVLWCSVPVFTEDEYEEVFKPRGDSKWQLHVFDMKDKEETVLNEPIGDYILSLNGEQIMVAREKDYFVAKLDDLLTAKKLQGEKVNRLKLNGMLYYADTLAEWNQIFSDTWRWYRDFFYDANMHGQDWKDVGERYRAMIPGLSSRAGLNWLMSQMVGELCVGHAYIGGGDIGPLTLPETPVYTGRLGADLAYDATAGFFRFAKIYGPSEFNLELTAPLQRPDIQLKEGDYLIAINGKTLQKNEDYWKYLQVSAGQEITVTVNSLPGLQNARTYAIVPLRSDRALRYNRWLTENVRKVLKATDHRVGYMHINAMGSGGIGEFDKFWRAFRNLEGIIIDVRRNSGGWTEYFLIDKLERQQVGFNVLRDMKPFRYPGSVGPQCYVAVSNEDNGSDGEAFIQHFQDRRLGPVVGTPSWGGLVGIINGQRTVDNGSVNQPNNAFYGKSGRWWVENQGAIPDIAIDNDPASVMAGLDLQLDKAIATIMAEIEKNDKNKFPKQPAYPDKK